MSLIHELIRYPETITNENLALVENLSTKANENITRGVLLLQSISIRLVTAETVHAMLLEGENGCALAELITGCFAAPQSAAASAGTWLAVNYWLDGISDCLARLRQSQAFTTTQIRNFYTISAEASTFQQWLHLYAAFKAPANLRQMSLPILRLLFELSPEDITWLTDSLFHSRETSLDALAHERNLSTAAIALATKYLRDEKAVHQEIAAAHGVAVANQFSRLQVLAASSETPDSASRTPVLSHYSSFARRRNGGESTSGVSSTTISTNSSFSSNPLSKQFQDEVSDCEDENEEAAARARDPIARAADLARKAINYKKC